MQKLLTDMVIYVVGNLVHNWLPLSLAILTAVIMKVYVNSEKLQQALLRRSNVSIPASVAFGALTPLCACGTMAVVIGLLSTVVPWGPVMAFLTSSPLMSPDGFILLAGVIGLKFAIAMATASIIIGLGSGYLTHLIEKKTGFLKDQTRFSEKPPHQTCGCSEPASVQTCGCSGPVSIPNPTCSCAEAAAIANQGCCDRRTGVNRIIKFFQKIKWGELADGLVNLGLKQILFYFVIFVAIGFLINRFVPTAIIVALFNPKNIFAVPLAALIGLPIYVNGESAIPLIKSLMAGGAGGGAMLAFLITGPGTSAGVVAGIATFMKKRAVILYTLLILGWGILLGYAYDLLLAMGL